MQLMKDEQGRTSGREKESSSALLCASIGFGINYERIHVDREFLKVARAKPQQRSALETGTDVEDTRDRWQQEKNAGSQKFKWG